MHHLPTTQETPKAAAAYAAYEAMGEDRSLDKLRRLLETDPQWSHNGTKKAPDIKSLKKWSVQYAWQDRAAAYDAAALDRERAERERAERMRARRRAERDMRREEERERMDDERAPIMRATWMRTLDDINQRMRQGETRGLVGLVALLKHAMDEERLCRGGATTINEQRVTGKDGESLMTPVGEAIAAALLLRMGNAPQTRDTLATALLQEASDDASIPADVYPR
jgi:hypothetical protein